MCLAVELGTGSKNHRNPQKLATSKHAVAVNPASKKPALATGEPSVEEAEDA
jgi:hypothetical protein